jgi:putative membrane protein
MPAEPSLVRRRILLTGLAFGLVTSAEATFAGLPPSGVPDEAYVGGALTRGALAIRTSLLARARSPNPEIRRFAASEIAEQDAIAAQIGVKPLFTRREFALLAEQDALPPGLEFDRIYVHRQIEGHRELLALNTAYARSGHDPHLVHIARGALPLIRTHLAVLHGIAPRLG